MDNTKLLMTEMKAMDSIKLDNIGLDKSETYPKEEVLPEDDLYRYIYQPGEQHGDQKRRAADFIWSENTYWLDRIVEDSLSLLLYSLHPVEHRL